MGSSRFIKYNNALYFGDFEGFHEKLSELKKHVLIDVVINER